MLPVVTMLASQGLNLLANAVMTKGQEVIEEKLGVKLETAKPEELRKLEIEHEEFLLSVVIQKREQELKFQAEQEKGITARWQADMLSDSWLSKNIRPMVLLFLLGAYSLFSIGSAFGMSISEAYVTLLGQWGMLVMTAYFGGRSLEKIVEMKEKSK